MCFQDGLRLSRAQHLRRVIVRAILELETEIGDEERDDFCNFKASVILRLFAIKLPLPGSLPFDSKFYTERVVPKVNCILNRECAPLEKLEVCTESDVADAYSKLCKQIKDLLRRRQAIFAQIQASRDLLHKTLRHEQWSLRFKLEQAQVDYTATTAAVYEKKFASVAKSVVELFREYRYEEAMESLRDRLEKEKAALKRDLDYRMKKHDIYKKALVLDPDLDDLLKKYQSLMVSIKSIQSMSSAP